MIHPCGSWTYKARLRESCVACAGAGCDCCANTGQHTESGAKHQRDHVHGAFMSKQAMWARPGKKEIGA